MTLSVDQSRPVCETDVLIVGAGPSGLTTALWMARLGVRTRIIDRAGHQVFRGQADGLYARTMEILDTFGDVRVEVERFGYPPSQIVTWGLDEDGKLHRKTMVDLVSSEHTSRFGLHSLHQGKVESLLMDSIRETSDIDVERGMLPLDLSLDHTKVDDPDAHPVRVSVRRLTEEEALGNDPMRHQIDLNGDYPRNAAALQGKAMLGESSEEIIQAKYVVGCDGAHSWTRQQIGSRMVGESLDYVWGVMDGHFVTNFPDVRKVALIQPRAGSLMFIGRENGLSRLYVRLADEKSCNRSAIGPNEILNTARKCLSPYTLECHNIDWWAVYVSGQRLVDRAVKSGRIFLGGDAVHTHSPQEGQGMNTSIGDAYNLGWKLGGFIRGTLSQSILKTYETERREVAEWLIDFDRRISKAYAGNPSSSELQDVYEENAARQSGIGIRYSPGVSIPAIEYSSDQKEGHAANGKNDALLASRHDLAVKVVPGTRFAPFEVVNHAEGRIVNTQDTLVSDGHWRVLVFGGSVKQAGRLEHVNKVAEDLSDASTGILWRYIPLHNHAGASAPIELLLVHSASLREVEWSAFHPAFRPFDDRKGYDYGKVFADAPPADSAYHGYGIDKEVGCIVAVRPDGIVGLVVGLDDHDRLQQYFDTVLVKHEDAR